jgi:hypothetical protein
MENIKKKNFANNERFWVVYSKKKPKKGKFSKATQKVSIDTHFKASVTHI